MTRAKMARYVRKPSDTDEPAAASGCIAGRQMLPCGAGRMRLTGVIPSAESPRMPDAGVRVITVTG
jgi:hypothetical protein